MGDRGNSFFLCFEDVGEVNVAAFVPHQVGEEAAAGESGAVAFGAASVPVAEAVGFVFGEEWV